MTHFACLRKGKLLSAKLLAQELCGEVLLGEPDLGPYTPWIAGNMICLSTRACLRARARVRVCVCISSIDMYNNDVGQESAQKIMKQTGDLKAATLYFAS